VVDKIPVEMDRNAYFYHQHSKEHIPIIRILMNTAAQPEPLPAVEALSVFVSYAREDADGECVT
jgi:hypothetical protein